MMCAGAALASTAMASQTALSTATTDAEAVQPLHVYLNGVLSSHVLQIDSLSIDDTLGEQVSCTFIIVNPATNPAVGDQVEVRYFSQTLFAGTIDRLTRRANPAGNLTLFECVCTDWAQILVRNVIERNFTNVPIVNLVDALLDNELAGEGLTLGTVDRGTTLPLVSSRGGSALDLLRDVAGVTGQTFYVDFDKSLQFRATTNPSAPVELDDAHLEDAELVSDRETYRNVQRVQVTGTPTSAAAQDANVVIVERANAEQIAARQALEGGSGRYEQLEAITHPTSNDAADLGLLGIGYANLLLATSGALRQTLSCRVRNYGFRAGQFATVNATLLGISGTWLIQKVSVREEAGQRVIHHLELVQSSLQQRAYQAWLKIVQSGKITVQMPGSLTSHTTVFDVPGTTTWTVPDGVTSVQFVCVGGSGAGSNWDCYDGSFHQAGAGGASGRAVAIVSVIAGQVFDLTIGAGGAAVTPVDPWPGPANAGTFSRVARNGVTLCQGNGGQGGNTSAMANPAPPLYRCISATAGNPGSGVGDAVSVGGGQPGGAPATSTLVDDAMDGQDGYIEISW